MTKNNSKHGMPRGQNSIKIYLYNIPPEFICLLILYSLAFSLSDPEVQHYISREHGEGTFVHCCMRKKLENCIVFPEFP